MIDDYVPVFACAGIKLYGCVSSEGNQLVEACEYNLLFVNVYHTLQTVQGGKLLQYAELNFNSLESFCSKTSVLNSQSLAYCTGYFSGKVL